MGIVQAERLNFSMENIRSLHSPVRSGEGIRKVKEVATSEICGALRYNIPKSPTAIYTWYDKKRHMLAVEPSIAAPLSSLDWGHRPEVFSLFRFLWKKRTPT